MWWVLEPRSIVHVHRELGGVRHGAQELLGRSESKSATSSAGRSPSKRRVGTAGHVNRAGGPRLVHGHHRVAVAADAACGHRAPRRGHGRARSRCPPPCGGDRSRGLPSPPRRGRAARGGRARRADDRRTPRRSSGTPSPIPSRLSAEPDVGLVRRCVSPRRCGSCAALHRLGVYGKALGAGERRPGRRKPGCGVVWKGYGGHPAPERGGGQRTLKAGRPACGEHVVAACHVVAERRGGSRAHEQAPGGTHRAGLSLSLRAYQRKVLGRNLVGQSHRGARVASVHERKGSLRHRGPLAAPFAPSPRAPS